MLAAKSVGGAKRKNNSKKMKAGSGEMEIDKTVAGVVARVEAFKAYDEAGGLITIIGSGPMKVAEYEAKPEGDIGIPYKFYYNQPTDLINGEGKEFMILLNSAMPYKEWYDTANKKWIPPNKTEADALTPEQVKAKAGMSFAHFLIVPRKPLFNAVTLKKAHADLLKDMKKTLLAKLQDPNFKQRVIYQVFYNIFDFADNKKTDITPEQFAQFKADAKKFMDTQYTEAEMEFFLHVAYINEAGKLDGNQSIPQLHLHGLEKNLRTSNVHDWKNMPVDSVVGYLETLQGGKKRISKKKAN
jgi:hypothetical protein